MRDLKSETFFHEMITAMEKEGFVLFSRAHISTDDVPYTTVDWYSHVRDTRLFFHVPNKNCIVILHYEEATAKDTDTTRSYWELEYVLGLASQAAADKFLWDGNRRLWLTLPGFYVCGGTGPGSEIQVGAKYAQTLSKKKGKLFYPYVNPNKLAHDIRTMLINAIELATPAPFRQMFVFSWPPVSSFKGCGYIFWSRMNRPRVRSLITRTYGSAGLE